MKNKTLKLISKILLVIILATSVLTLSSCGAKPKYWTGYSHQSFVEKIEEYNSKHDLFVNTFISFDLDSNEKVLECFYEFEAMVPFTRLNKILYDKWNDNYIIYQIFYLDGYKIMCRYSLKKFNFTQEDKIEIKLANHSCYQYDEYYVEPMSEVLIQDKTKIYNYVSRYKIYVNGTEFACLHISSVDEASEEKLAELVQMMQDSLVVINTEKFFIWRNVK